MQKEEIRFQDSCVFEGMTSIRAILRGIDSGVNDRKIEKILYDTKKADKNKKELGYLKAVERRYGYSLFPTDAEELDQLSLGTSHGGIIAVCGERSIPSLATASTVKENGFYAMIEGIEDPYNFGYALRTLYACGCSGIILPERNWFSASGVVARSSAGASELFAVYTASATDAIDFFKVKGYAVVAADERTDNILGKCELKMPLLLIVGGEKRGISRKVLDMCDTLVKINYARQFRASLSAASATTMFAYEIMRQNEIKIDSDDQ